MREVCVGKKNIFGKLNHVLMSTRTRKLVRGVDGVFQKALGKNYDKTIGRMKNKIRYKGVSKVQISENSFGDLCWHFEEPLRGTYEPLVSIIVPNFNHAPYLKERLDSIYNQTYSQYEVLLLDDCSTDESRAILMQAAEEHPGNTRLVFNETNSGNAFAQWKKGISLAKGELIWIAESDDYSQPHFLAKMVEQFRMESVRIAFCPSAFMKEGKQIWSTAEYLQDLDRFRFDKPFCMSAYNMVRFGFARHNMIPNVSSAVFRNIGTLPGEANELCGQMELSGDWIFYLALMEGGVVAYTNEVTNFYRIHEESTSLRVQKTNRYYEEFAQVSRFVARHFGITRDTLKQNLEYLQYHFGVNRSGEDASVLDTLYPVEDIFLEQEKALPRIALGVYALCPGGGETYPIYLANEMRRQQVPVTLINFQIEETDPRIRALVDSKVPLVNLSNRNDLIPVLKQLGVSVIHTHQTYMDELASVWVEQYPEIKQVVSFHGMYETVAPETADRVLSKVQKTCEKYIYIADKNLEPVKRNRIPVDGRFVKLPNGIPTPVLSGMTKKQLGIAETNFTLTLASRGLPEKGWKQAVLAVKAINEKLPKEEQVHLILLGDGPAMEEIRSLTDDTIHCMGTVSNVCDYFALADAGLLPTYYKGESFPLSVAECLSVGTPVIATDIGEIRNQLKDSKGNLAGLLLTYREEGVSVEELADRIQTLRQNTEKYGLCRESAREAGKKFAIEDVVKQHLLIYKEVRGENR